jgi:tetratricopeptide (TPR) repeat protein
MRRTHLLMLLLIAASAMLQLVLPHSTSPAEAPAQPVGPFAALIKEVETASRANDYARAIALLTSALADDKATDDDRRELLRRRAFAHEWARQFVEAEADWKAVVEIKPVDPALLYKRGFFYKGRARYDEALADFAAGKGLDPTDPWFASGEGEVRSARREYRIAIVAYSEAIRLDPKMMRAYLGRGSAYNYENMHAEARDDYNTVLADFEQKGRATKFLPPREMGLAYLGRGYASNHLGDYARAKSDFDKVLADVPKSSNALEWRGVALENLGDPQRALADYKAALAVKLKDDWISERVRLLEGR